MIWADTTPAEKVELVRELVERQGLSYRLAANALGTTRTAVAGVADRARDKGTPIRAEKIAPVKARVGSEGGKAMNTHAKAARARQRAFDGPPELVEGLDAKPLPSAAAWQPLPGSAPVRVHEHTNGCRWPIGVDLPFLYCNEPLKDGSIYCLAHSAIAYKEVPMRREIRKEDR